MNRLNFTRIVISLTLFTMQVKAFAQLNKCAFDETRKFIESSDTNYYKQMHQADIDWWTYYRNQHPEDFDYRPYNGLESRSSCPKARIIIPVAVHVIHNNGSENINIAQARNAIAAMNDHYANSLGGGDPLAANTGIRFVLARFDKVQNSLTSHKKTTQSGALMALKMADADTFLNIWVVKDIRDTSGGVTGILGYSTYPGRWFSGGYQGVVVRYNYFGTSAFGSPVNSNSHGDVLTHECGHYLGLLHPFEGGCVGLYATTAYLEGDLCKDVPAVAQQDTNCVSGANSCTEFYTFPPYSSNPPDQKQLFMDYSAPLCKTSFTRDQVKLMFSRLQQYHPTLGSPLYMPLGYPDSCIAAARIDGQTDACKGDSFSLQTYSLSGASYTWQLYKGGTFITTYSGGSKFKYGPDTGIYTVYLQVNIGGKNVYDTLRNIIEILDCTKRIHSTKGTWMFAQLAGLKFTQNKTVRDIGPSTNNPPSARNINAPEASACMSDSLGNLIFYAAPENKSFLVQNGKLHIWGKNYIEIKGSPLDSVNLTAMQAALIVPMPDSVGKYYLFYNTRNADFCYYAVLDPRDSSINSFSKKQYGRVTRKNNFVSLPDTVFGSGAICGEALTAVPQCDPTKFWLFLHNMTDGKLAVFDVSAGDPTYHSYFGTSFTNIHKEYAVLFNPQGTKFHFGHNIYNFDRSAGVISLYKNLDVNLLDEVWGSMWSSDGNTFYRTEGFTDGTYYIYQYDLQSSDTLLNRTLVSKSATYRVMQLGPDGKIYIATDNQPFLSEIQKPNAMNYAAPNNCKFEPIGVLLKKGTSGGISNWASLPNLINAEKEIINKAHISFTIVQSNCKTVAVEPNICCAASFRWLWGDGSATLGRIANHTYSTNGTYTIGLVINSTDTIFKSFNAGIPSGVKVVYGPDTVCANTTLQEYNMTDSVFYSYKWKITNGTISSSDFNRVMVNLNTGTSSVKGILTNTRNGCKDSASKTVIVPTPVSNNVIDSSQILCNSGQLHNIVGQTPTGGTGSYAYAWYVKPILTTGNFRKLIGSTGINLNAINNDTSYFYVRLVTSGNCKYESNRLSKIWLTDIAKIQMRDSSCSIILESKAKSTFGLSLTFQWQSSTDSSTWSNVSGATDIKYIVSKSSVIGYFRLKVVGSGCTLFSAGVKPKPEITITTQPQNAGACGNMSFQLQCAAVNNYGGNVTYQWQWNNTATIPTVWSALQTGSSGIFANSASGFSHEQQFRCVIIGGCGTKTSNVVSLKKIILAKIINSGKDTNIAGGQPMNVFANWQGEPPAAYVVWERSKNPEGGKWDSLGKSIYTNYTVTVPNYSECQRRWYYRAALRNFCPASSTNYWIDTVASKPIQASKYSPGSNSDLWIPDEMGDWNANGVEPNFSDNGRFTHSKWLWNRLPQDSGVRLTDAWTGRVNIKADTINLVHAMVYNKGSIPSNGGKINFYWTVNSLNEDWPAAWTGRQRFFNADSGKFFPRGGKINKTPISIPNLNPGDSALITFRWKPSDTIPKPGWYYGVVRDTIVYSNEIGMCLLGRIETCDTPSFGMEFPEKLNKDTSVKKNTGNIKYNILSNNNIASANFYVSYIHPPFSRYVKNWTILESAMKNPHNDQGGHDHYDRAMLLSLCVNDPVYFTTGEVLVTLPDEYWTRFVAAGMPGSGFNYTGDANRIVVYSPCANIGPVMVPDSLSEMIGLTWRKLPSSGSAHTSFTAEFTLQEYLDDSLNGTCQYLVYSVIDGPGGDDHGGGTEGAAAPDNKVGTSKQSVNVKVLTITPNPFNNYLDITYKGLPSCKVRLEMYNANGKLVKLICDCTADSEGKVSIRNETANLAQGDYTVRAIENGKTAAEKVIRCQ